MLIKIYGSFNYYKKGDFNFFNINLTYFFIYIPPSRIYPRVTFFVYPELAKRRGLRFSQSLNRARKTCGRLVKVSRKTTCHRLNRMLTLVDETDHGSRDQFRMGQGFKGKHDLHFEYKLLFCIFLFFFQQ